MELRHIRYFLAIADEMNFTRAAARLGIAQPPLSQQMKDLEREIGTQLFLRTSRGVELTEAGQAFLRGVASIPSQAATSVRAAQRAARGEIGLVRVGFTSSAVFRTVVPSSIRAFRHAAPDVELTVQEGSSNLLAKALRDGNLDAAFLRPDAMSPEGLDTRLIDSEPMVAAVPISLEVDGSGRIRLADLARFPFVLTPRHLGPTLVDVVLRACSDVGFEPILGQSAPQISSVLALVSAELGVSVVPSSMRRAMVEGVRYLELSDVQAVANLAIACRHGEAAMAVRRFVDQAVERHRGVQTDKT